jgi:aspartyl/glutamyl-tRNA(Asn/Gln) amidotransferase C subunit
MIKITKKELKQLSEALYFGLPDDLLDSLYNEADQILIGLNKIKQLNVDNLQPTDYCVSTTAHKLRPDVPVLYKNPQELLKNAHKRHGKYVVVK